MAEKLLLLYKYANEKGGMKAKMALAKHTLIPSTKAAMEQDSPENISKFREAIKNILGDYPPQM